MATDEERFQAAIITATTLFTHTHHQNALWRDKEATWLAREKALVEEIESLRTKLAEERAERKRIAHKFEKQAAKWKEYSDKVRRVQAERAKGKKEAPRAVDACNMGHSEEGEGEEEDEAAAVGGEEEEEGREEGEEQPRVQQQPQQQPQQQQQEPKQQLQVPEQPREDPPSMDFSPSVAFPRSNGSRRLKRPTEEKKRKRFVHNTVTSGSDVSPHPSPKHPASKSNATIPPANALPLATTATTAAAATTTASAVDMDMDHVSDDLEDVHEVLPSTPASSASSASASAPSSAVGTGSARARKLVRKQHYKSNPLLSPVRPSRNASSAAVATSASKSTPATSTKAPPAATTSSSLSSTPASAPKGKTSGTKFLLASGGSALTRPAPVMFNLFAMDAAAAEEEHADVRKKGRTGMGSSVATRVVVEIDSDIEQDSREDEAEEEEAVEDCTPRRKRTASSSDKENDGRHSGKLAAARLDSVGSEDPQIPAVVREEDRLVIAGMHNTPSLFQMNSTPEDIKGCNDNNTPEEFYRPVSPSKGAPLSPHLLQQEEDDEGDTRARKAGMGSKATSTGPLSPLIKQRDMRSVAYAEFRKKKEEADRRAYAYEETVRKRDERAKLDGFDCVECRRYYMSLKVPEDVLRERLNAISRHKHICKPVEVRASFWEVDFPSTQSDPHQAHLLNLPRGTKPDAVGVDDVVLLAATLDKDATAMTQEGEVPQASALSAILTTPDAHPQPIPAAQEPPVLQGQSMVYQSLVLSLAESASLGEEPRANSSEFSMDSLSPPLRRAQSSSGSKWLSK